jgi:CubicO group peptidase (beta-lactamase class C family)
MRPYLVGRRSAPACLLLSVAMLCGCSSGPIGGGDDGDEDGDTTGSGDSSGTGSGSGTGAGGGSTGPGSGGASSSSSGSGGSGGEVPFVACPFADFQERFEQVRASFQSQLQAAGVRGGALAIVCQSELLADGVGVVKDGGAPVTGQTLFQLASMTKMFTGTVAAALADKGVVDMDAPVGAILPSLAYGNEVTLAHLASHGSGLPVQFPNYNQEQLVPLVESNAGMSTIHTPGTHWEYSNDGFAILGGLLEVASNTPFDELVHQEVFERIGMAGATMRVSEAVASGDYAFGHNGSKVLSPEDSYYAAPWYGPMGGGWASAEDMGKYARAILGLGHMKAQFAAQAEPQIETGQYAGESYGYGLFLDYGVQPQMIYHSGSVEGFLSDTEVVPSEGMAAVVMVNDTDWYPGQVAFEALSAFIDLGY